MYTVAVVTNLKQLTYRVPGTFKFNKSNFICNGNAEGQSGGGGRPQNEQSGLFFLSLSTIAERFMSAPVRRTAIPCTLQPLQRLSLFFYFTFYSIPFSSRPPIPNIRVGPPGTTTPRVRSNNTRKLHWDSFYSGFFSTG